jgi:hypothetical protein
MPKTLELWWDFSSPFAYLGAVQAEALAARTGATLVWRPMLLGGLFRAIGQVDAPVLTWSEQKRDYYFKDLARWAEFLGVPFRFPSRFPTSTIKALRCHIALEGEPAKQRAFREATFRAYWSDDRDIADDAVLTGLIGDGAADVLAKTQQAAVKQALIASTHEAQQLGIFGAPTWIVRESGKEGFELFWGQDRVQLVERALTSD